MWDCLCFVTSPSSASYLIFTTLCEIVCVINISFLCKLLDCACTMWYCLCFVTSLYSASYLKFTAVLCEIACVIYFLPLQVGSILNSFTASNLSATPSGYKLSRSCLGPLKMLYVCVSNFYIFPLYCIAFPFNFCTDIPLIN